ncbi:galactose mutarotase [Streptococcus didelphis]|uniref:Aldose 1-epimerase n=1 Tax=Streptococcus didelphis TaxID=102886 RepID=A0ABY9LIT4_9STRE|nr:aldose epimerase family protein [Streptococcus didelphis]WMB28746.1 galactose mutarotase [Streptococcus didelphis]
MGRSAGRLAGGRFSLHGKTYQLRQNQGENNLHSGPNGYQIRLFQLVPEETSETQLTLSLESPDGDQGYPGNLTFSVSFELNQTNELTITYKAISDQDTLFNVTNHSYFNLNGHESGSIEAHSLQLKAKTFTPLENEAAIPSGEIREVTGSAFDFQEAKPIGRDINAKEQQILYAGGYDHNWILTEPSLLKPFARAIGDQTGIQLEVFTDLPGVQVYTGNFIDNEKGKDGTIYGKRAGFCLETQFYPNAVNFPHFPSPIIKANQEVRHKTKYRLSLREL